MSESKESRRAFFQKTAASSLGLLVAPGILKAEEPYQQETPLKVEPEWRNKQTDMQYRMLGRTGMMVSELVLGTFPFDNDSFFTILDKAIEKGINYFDSAAAYSQGGVESTMGRYFKKSGNREKVFLTTKLSSYYGVIDGYVNEIMKGLPSAKQESLRTKVQRMIDERTVMRPGYHMNYFNGQEKQFATTYLRHIVLKEYGYKKEWKTQIKKSAYKLLESSLKRLETDYLDVLFCPHGSSMPEMMDDILKELFAEFKQKGLVKAAAVSFHNDVSSNLNNAIKVGYYDVAMFAYNIANHAALESSIYQAKQAGMGLVAMKNARLFAMNNQPKWREDKLNTALPNVKLSVYAKAYLWALQNPNLSCCVSQMETEEILNENLLVIGKKVDVQKV